MGALHFNDGALFDAGAGVLTVSSATFDGFGIDDLTNINLMSLSEGIYTLIEGSIDTTNLENLGLANAVDLGNGHTAHYEEGSLNLVITAIPEPSTALLGGLGILCLLRRRRA